MLTFGGLPIEVQRLLNEIVREVEQIERHIEDRNYGLAAGQIETVMQLLPADNGEYVSWFTLEERTR